MAEVWIGKMTGGRDFEKIVAIKLLSRENIAHPVYQRCLGDEARVLVSLKHPNVVEILDFNFDSEGPYLVMDYIEGVELREILLHLRESRQTMPLGITAYMMIEIAQGLLHAHERCDRKSGKPLGIIHRDISPSNILISHGGEALLTDFGIAKSTLQSDRTQAGQLKGKFRYMSPEQAAGEMMDHRSDIFSIGLVFYECLFGSPAYDGASDPKIFEKAREARIAIPATVDDELREILERLLTADPGGRYPRLKFFIDDLKTYVAGKNQVCSREMFQSYLEGLKVAGFEKARALREETERWNLRSGTRPKAENDGATLNYRQKGPRKRMKATALTGVLVACILFVASLAKRPGASQTPLTSISDIGVIDSTPSPSPVPSPKPPSSPPQPAPKRKVKVIFNADPYAEVSISGAFRGVETPVQEMVSEGKHTVTFVHPPSGQRITATLNVTDPDRTYVCTARIGVDAESNTPSASCRIR